jgi:uncharacterized protein YndB with AHSA1/START domain
MSRSRRLFVTSTSAAPPDIVFSLLVDTNGWTAWSLAEEASVVTSPSGEPEGVGAVRTFRTGRTTSVERVVAFDRPSHFSYELVSGLPLVDYRADVRLVPNGGGTAITWESSFRTRFPTSGFVYQRMLQRFIAKTADRLARAAEDQGECQ